MKIFIYDEFGPEDLAMMQALYSRSAQSVEKHVEKVRQTGSGKFMETFYVGYGHASIADCGSTTMFIEGVSMLTAKAIEDWNLFSGQETSSRYIDFSQQPIIDPLGTKQSGLVLRRWMDFYINSREKLESHLRIKYPRGSGEDEKVYTKAIAARAFDILRGFLPAGITTQLSWHTNLRQAHDKLDILKHHPLAEVRDVATEMISQLKSKYAHSFSHPMNKDQEVYRQSWMEKYNYYLPAGIVKDFSGRTTVKRSELSLYKKILNQRPPKVGLPNFLAELGQVSFEFLLDFGSFRDIQRHRNGVCRMPLLTTKFGFHQWYLDQLPTDLAKEAKTLIKEQIIAIKKLSASPELRQYYTAMGFQVACKVAYNLPAAVYVMELRSGQMVHPTLRRIAHQMGDKLAKLLPEIKTYIDRSPDVWDIRRGLQDIEEKKRKN